MSRTVLALQSVLGGVEVEEASNTERSHHLGRGDECVCGSVCVVAACEVAVVRVDDGVLLSFLDVCTVPLADAGAASVGQHCAAKLPERLSLQTSHKRLNKDLKIIVHLWFV